MHCLQAQRTQKEQTDSSLFVSHISRRCIEESYLWDFPGGTVVKNLPSNAGDSGSIPGQGTKLLRAAGQLSTHATTGAQVWVPQVERSRVPKENFHVPQLRPDTAIQK